MKWTVVIESEDGSLAVVGPFSDQLAATEYGNEHETAEDRNTCHVLPLETP
jgi:hypothetical protein